MSSKELPKTKTIINHRFLRQLFTEKNQHQNNRPTLGRKKIIWKISVPIETSSVCMVTQCRTRVLSFCSCGVTQASPTSGQTCLTHDPHAITLINTHTELFIWPALIKPCGQILFLWFLPGLGISKVLALFCDGAASSSIRGQHIMPL